MASRRPRIVFIARAFPPTVGGMENLALQLSTHMQDLADVTPIINRRGKAALPAFVPYAAIAGVRAVRRHDADAVHLADALLAPVGAAIKAATGVPVTASICGLDVTYPSRVYQALIPRALRRLDLVMPISAATETAMRNRTGVRPPSRVIPLGVNPLPTPDGCAYDQLDQLMAVPPGSRVVLTVGRLIERKGAAWFAEQVLPLLGPDAVYVLIGDGPHRDAIMAAATAAGVAARLRLLGRLPDNLLAAAYQRADIFVMPNVPVPDDFEGFGLVALEASASGLPVVASALEGITEAIQQERNGILVRPLDASAFAREISRLLGLSSERRREVGSTFARHTDSHYGWRQTSRRYVEAIDALPNDARIRHRDGRTRAVRNENAG